MKIRAILGASILLVSGPVSANLIVNGGFEEPFGIGTYIHRNGGELTGWTLYSDYRGTVHFDTDYAPVSEGSQSVQIEVPGDWISQSFATVAGQEYSVSFDLSAFGGYGGYTGCNPYCDSLLGVTAGSASGVFAGSSETYVTLNLLFTAISSASTLKFENLYYGDRWGNYPHLDNVSVSSVPPVPIPAAVWLFGTGLLGLIGFSRRRNVS